MQPAFSPGPSNISRFSGHPRFVAAHPLFGAEKAGNPSGAGGASEAGDQADIRRTAVDDAKKAAQENKKLNQATFYQLTLPVLAGALWLIPFVGPILGMGISYMSGHKGRRLKSEIQADKLEGPAEEYWRLSEMLKEQGKYSGNQLGDQFDLLVAAGAAAKYPGVLHRIVPPLLAQLGKLKLGQSRKFVMAMQYATRGKGKGAAGAAGASKVSLGIRLLSKFLVGFSINMQVAREETLPKAALEAGKGLALYAMGPFALVLAVGDWIRDQMPWNRNKAPKPSA